MRVRSALASAPSPGGGPAPGARHAASAAPSSRAARSGWPPSACAPARPVSACATACGSPSFCAAVRHWICQERAPAGSPRCSAMKPSSDSEMVRATSGSEPIRLARAQHVANVGFGDVEPALPARRLAEAELREDVPRQVALLGRQAHGPFEELAGLGQVTGVQRAPAQPRQGIGRLRPQAEVLGHAQAVPVQPVCPRVVPGCRRSGTEPFDGLQLPPAVTELAEYLQALLGVAMHRGRVAPDHRQLGAGAQGRRDSPLAAERAEACQRPGDHGLAHGWVTEIRRDEGVEPLQRGPDGGVVDAVGRRRGGMPAALSGESGKTAQPGRGRGPAGSGSLAEG